MPEIGRQNFVDFLNVIGVSNLKIFAKANRFDTLAALALIEFAFLVRFEICLVEGELLIQISNFLLFSRLVE